MQLGVTNMHILEGVVNTISARHPGLRDPHLLLSHLWMMVQVNCRVDPRTLSVVSLRQDVRGHYRIICRTAGRPVRLLMAEIVVSAYKTVPPSWGPAMRTTWQSALDMPQDRMDRRWPGRDIEIVGGAS